MARAGKHKDSYASWSCRMRAGSLTGRGLSGPRLPMAMIIGREGAAITPRARASDGVSNERNTLRRAAREGGERNGGAGRAHSCERRRCEARRPAPPAARAPPASAVRPLVAHRIRSGRRRVACQQRRWLHAGGAVAEAVVARAAGRPHRLANPAPPAEPP